MTKFPRLKHYSKAEQLVSKCLELEPQKRLSAEEALKHEFFKALPYAVFSLSPRKFASR